MNLFTRAGDWLRQTLTDNASTTVRIVRGAYSVEVAGVIGHTIAERTTEDGIVLTARIRDYLVPVVAYRLNGLATTPQRGDRFIEADGAVFEALPPSGEPLWRWSDPSRTTYRIHAQRVTP
jgi:hypothetical protein